MRWHREMYAVSFMLVDIGNQPFIQVDKLKHQYLAKIRRADEAEDEYVTSLAGMTFSLTISV